VAILLTHGGGGRGQYVYYMGGPRRGGIR